MAKCARMRWMGLALLAVGAACAGDDSTPPLAYGGDASMATGGASVRDAAAAGAGGAGGMDASTGAGGGGGLDAAAGGADAGDAARIVDSTAEALPDGADASRPTTGGEYLVTHLLACTDCHTQRKPDHSPDMTKFLAGNPAFAVAPIGPDGGLVPVGSSNLTPDPGTGLGGWTDTQIKRAFLDGVDDEGKPLISIMPYFVFHNMSSSDADAIVAYLRSIPEISQRIPDHPELLAPAPPTNPATIPNTTLPSSDPAYASAQRGRYLAAQTGACIECHTKRANRMNVGASPGPVLDAKAYFAGGEPFPRDELGLPPTLPANIDSANITPDPSTGIAGFTTSAVVNVLLHGVAPGGLLICPPMPVGATGPYGGLTNQDALDIANYILSLPPITNNATCAPGSCGGDGCGATCACAAGSVCLADGTCCRPNLNPCGPDGCGGTHGECTCVPSCNGKQCGNDGCGGTCGSCAAGTSCDDGTCVAVCVAPWSPSWQQMASAGSWWAEFRVVGNGSLARSVTIEVPQTKTTYPLSGGWGSWTSGLHGLASGTIVVLHATDATGATAQTVPFRYLVDRTPSTDPCRGTSSTISTCRPLAKGMVSLTMDDSLPSQATLALPVMNKYGVRATIYEVSNQLAQYNMVPLARALAAAGNEIGSHSRTHADFLTLTADQMDQELGLSQQYLVANVVGPVESFATPMGDYNATAVQEIKKYYASHRTVNPGLNFMGDDVYQLKADGVYGGMPVEAICAQVAEAAAQKGWRIFVFHNFTTQTAAQSLEYEVSSFDALLACAKATPGLDIVTTREGAAMLKCASP